MGHAVKLLFPLAALVISVSACAAAPVNGVDNNPRKPISLDTKQKELLNLGQSFSLEFLDRIEKDSSTEDYVISPLSIQFLLGMILNGAKDKTADEIRTVLGYGESTAADVNEFCKAMLRQLPALDKNTKLMIADAIVVDEGYKLRPAYSKTVEDYYDAQISNLDFKDTKRSADKINRWCYEHTEGLIPHILDEVSPAMLCYLLNALYFKGEWTEKFNKAYTTEEPFFRNGKEVAKVPLMSNFGEYNYTENELFQAVSLPYGNGAFSMAIMLPAGKHTTAEIIAHLKKTGWDYFKRTMYDRQVDLFIPRFETKYHKELNEILSAMGMPTSFKDNANFSDMSPDALKLSFVQQDAVIKVDEEGAEAAAISSAGMEKATAIPMDPPVVLRADHPFIYIISEYSTGAILFAGRYSAI